MVNSRLLFWICAVMYGVAASCVITSHTATDCCASNGKVDSSKTNSEVVKSSKWFVVNAAFLDLYR